LRKAVRRADGIDKAAAPPLPLIRLFANVFRVVGRPAFTVFAMFHYSD
jgi:hypothetical protein